MPNVSTGIYMHHPETTTYDRHFNGAPDVTVKQNGVSTGDENVCKQGWQTQYENIGLLRRSKWQLEFFGVIIYRQEAIETFR